MKRGNVKRLYCGLACMMIAGMTVTFGACGNGAGEKTFPTPTERPTSTDGVAESLSPTPTETPKSWIDQLLEEGRTELSQEWLERKPLETENYLKVPVSVTKTVRLGDFEYSMSVPKAIFGMEALKNGTDVLETTSTLRYVGEEESVMIAHGDLIFTGEIVDAGGNVDGGGSFDVEVHTELKKGEEITFTKVYEEFSKAVDTEGAGVIITTVQFDVLDENEERTGERYKHLISIPFDVLE